jgi:hypothetical protein
MRVFEQKISFAVKKNQGLDPDSDSAAAWIVIRSQQNV